ncbi:MAG: diacylglycerol kinase, partial [Ferruginibacter sp.]
MIFLINPIAGTKDKSGLRKKIEKRAKEDHIIYFISDTNPSGEYGYLNEIILKEKITDVIICG